MVLHFSGNSKRRLNADGDLSYFYEKEEVSSVM